MERHLLNGYLALIIISLLFMNQLFIDRVLVCLWLFAIILAMVAARKKGGSLVSSLKLYALYQLPAIISSFVILYSKLKGINNEWANGILEIWTHPFFPLFEFFPTNPKWNLSSAYLLACFIPFSLLLMNVVVFQVVRPKRYSRLYK